jgi:tripartite-type tricarboxylate transporter receptor subunit TctC
MHRRTLIAGLLAAPMIARAQAPATTLVIPFAPGGPTDALGRLLSDSLARELGAPVVVENVAGAGGTLGAARVAQARPDGSVLLLHNIGMATAPTLYRRLPYDPVADFEPIGLVTPVPMVWIARPDLPMRDFAAMLAWVREKREGVNLAHAGLGSASHLCGALLQAQLGVAMTPVVFRGTGPVFAELMAGRIDIVCDQTTSATPYIQGGQVKAYAVTSPEPLPMLPGVPNASAAGLPGFEVAIWHGLYAPRGTPPEVVARVNAALRGSLADPRVVQRLGELGTVPEPASRMTPAAHRAFLAAEIARWRPILQAAGQYAD